MSARPFMSRRGTLLSLVAAVALLWPPGAGAVAQSGAQGVVVWDFENLTPGARAPGAGSGSAYLARSLSENLTVALLGFPGVEVVERQRLKDVLAEQRLSAGDLADDDSRIRLGRIIGAGRMVFGSFFALGDLVQVSVRVIDTATSRVLFSDELAAPADAVLQQVEPMNRRLVRVLGDGDPDIRRYPASAWRAYDEALTASDAGRYGQAIEMLQRLVANNKDFTPAERQLLALLGKLSRR
jgi:TolB-like protein